MSAFARGYINDVYGSRRGLLNHAKYALLHWSRHYAPYHAIDWSRVSRLVFICKGNICRSPLASAYAASRGSNAESFGTDCADGHPADDRAIDYAARIGVDLNAHRTRHVRQLEPARQDLIVVMEPAHLPSVERVRNVAQVTLAGLWLRRPNPYVHDPYSANGAYFDRCESLVIAAVQQILQHSQHQERQ